MRWNGRTTAVRRRWCREYWLAATDEEAAALRAQGLLVAGPETVRAAALVSTVFPGAVAVGIGDGSGRIDLDHSTIRRQRSAAGAEVKETREPPETVKDPTPPPRQGDFWGKK